MSTPAQEEADRYLSQKEHHPSHPEDRVDNDSDSPQSSHSNDNQQYSNEYHVDSGKDLNDDEDTLHSMTTTTTTPATYRLPTTRFTANTGPKGVISDAQLFNQAKKSTLRSSFAAFTSGTLSAVSHSSQSRKASGSKKEDSVVDTSDGELGASDEEDFLRQWRQNRLKELASRGSVAQRRQYPTKRVWGTLDDVDANGYLDAVEKVPDDAVVVVCIYDPLSNASAAVEDNLATLAQKHITTRFVKLDKEIAEMEHIAVPAILAYRAGDVFATLSGCRSDGLEAALRRNGVLG